MSDSTYKIVTKTSKKTLFVCSSEKISVFIPVIFIALHDYDMNLVYIKEISCRLLPKRCLEIYLILILLWLVIPERKYFKNSGLFEIL